MRFRFSYLILSAVIIGGSGCDRKETTKSAQSSRPMLRKVVLQTDWFPQAEHGGFYQAQARGFYAEAGLAVDILPGGPGAGIKLKVARGEADFGMNRSDDILLAASQGLPLVMVAATMQHDPMGLMVHAASPVKTFADLNGRTVIGNVGMAYLPYLERKFGIHFEKRQNTYGIGEFLANREIIQQCVLTSEPYFAEQQGRAVRTLQLASSGYDCYHVIFCRRDLVRLAPVVVGAFVQASIRGWRDYLFGDAALGDALILQRNPQMTPELLNYARSEMIIHRLVDGDPLVGEGIGQLSLTRLEEQAGLLLALQILEVPVALAGVATRQFLPARSLP